MTTKKEKNANDDVDTAAEVENETDASTENTKSNKVAEKLKAMGVMSSGKKSADGEDRKYSPLLITVLIAVPVVGVIAYMNMPEKFNSLLSSVTSSFSTSSESSASDTSYAPQMSAESLQDANTLAWNQPQYQQPEWVKQQRAEMEKRRQEFEQQNADRYGARQVPSQPPEPPQWVKDRQKQMEQERARYQQEWSSRQQQPPANWSYNGAPESPAYMQHPQMNSYQPNGAAQPQMPQYQNPVNANAQAQRQYYNARPYPANPYYYNRPAYGYAPNVPYGWNGYPNR
ncbi:MAG: hypothetical protein OQK76_11610 [Gammaproteobacteria bacterium]|nr:hypothetical protein [Gammaproteobacteria bacterium]MCW9005596.1 hypothetical protein [Gammaproteobacteria bacterium]